MSEAGNQTAHQALGERIVAKMPGMAQLLLRAAFKGGSYSVGDAVPPIRYRVDGVRIDREHLARYQAICGYRDPQVLPPAYLNLLAFPLFMVITADKRFPMKAMGQVFMSNCMSVHKPLSPDAVYSFRAAIVDSRLTPHGLEWQVKTEALVDGELVWSALATTLYRCKTGLPKGEKAHFEEYDHLQEWSVAEDTGRRFARISGDYNPIHLYRMTARLLGFKRAIAHGMWSMSRALAEMQPQLPAAGFSAATHFHKPLFLPSSVRFSWRKNTDYHFALFNQSGEIPHLTGSITLE